MEVNEEKSLNNLQKAKTCPESSSNIASISNKSVNKSAARQKGSNKGIQRREINPVKHTENSDDEDRTTSPDMSETSTSSIEPPISDILYYESTLETNEKTDPLNEANGVEILKMEVTQETTSNNIQKDNSCPQISSEIASTSNKSKEKSLNNIKENSCDKTSSNSNTSANNLATHQQKFNTEKYKKTIYHVNPKVEFNYPVQGRRIVDFEYFYKSLQEISDHNKLLGCNLSNVKVVSETRNVLHSTYRLVCEKCNEIFHIDSEPKTKTNVNKVAGSGIMFWQWLLTHKQDNQDG